MAESVERVGELGENREQLCHPGNLQQADDARIDAREHVRCPDLCRET